MLLSLLCVQKFVLARDLSAAVKWVQALQGQLSFVEACMDRETPFPIRALDVKQYVLRWMREGVPNPASPAFVEYMTSAGRGSRL